MTEDRTDPDRLLVEQAARGSREAFDDLVRRHERRVYNLVCALTGDPGGADDLAQEAFVRAFRAISRFRGDSAFRTWLYRIVVNVVQTHRSRQARRRQVFADQASGADGTGEVRPEPAAAGTDLEEAMVRRDLIDRALATLPEDLKTTVVLRDVQGLEYREIAAVMGVPLGTVESRLFRARQRLRPLLAPLVGASADQRREREPADGPASEAHIREA